MVVWGRRLHLSELSFRSLPEAYKLIWQGTRSRASGGPWKSQLRQASNDRTAEAKAQPVELGTIGRLPGECLSAHMSGDVQSVGMWEASACIDRLCRQLPSFDWRRLVEPVAMLTTSNHVDGQGKTCLQVYQNW